MTATADSRITRICATIWIRNSKRLIIDPLFRNMVSRCPAIMFEVNCTANVPGQIMFPIVSTNVCGD
jgi:hypothetical protein